MAKIKICLDAGHYGKYNQSPAVKAYYESDMSWKLHKLLKTALEAYGIEVITTRADKNKDKELVDRGKAAKGCNLFISIHSDAVGSYVDEKADRPTVYAPISGKGDTIGKALAECIAETMNTKQKGSVKCRACSYGDYYGVIRGAVSVGVVGLLIEHSFHTNTRSTNWLLEDANLKKLAEAEAAVIAKYYGISKKKEKTEAADSGELYRVRKSWKDAKSQKGAFKSLASAKKVADANKGFYVFDSKGAAIYPTAFKSYKVKVTTDTLNVRSGAGTNHKVNTTVKKGEVYTIVAEKTVSGTKWLKLKSGAGWISSEHVKKM